MPNPLYTYILDIVGFEGFYEVSVAKGKAVLP